MSNAHLLVSLSSARSTTITSEFIALHWLPIQKHIKFKVVFLHPTYLTYYSCNHNADSLDHPHLPISLSCPEPMLCHLQIAHSPVFDQRNGTLSLTTSRMLTLFTPSRNSSNVFYSNKCININFIQMS